MDRKAVKINAQHLLHEGHIRVMQYHYTMPLFQGGMSQPISREIFQTKDAAGVLPYDPIGDEIVLIEQYRPCGLPKGQHIWTMEAVAGVRDKQNESLHALARREAREEAGLTLGDLKKIGAFWMSPGNSSEFYTLYCGEVDASKATGIHGVDDENIAVHVLKAGTVLSKIGEPPFNNAPLIIALQWLALHRNDLKKQWLNK